MGQESTQAIDQAVPGGTKVIIYYADHQGEKVKHFFRSVPK